MGSYKYSSHFGYSITPPKLGNLISMYGIVLLGSIVLVSPLGLEVWQR
jgi:hypothetical protein